MDSTNQDQDRWFILGKAVPKQEIVFFSQITILYILIITCLVNLTLNNSSQLWSSLLSTSVGILLPSPSIKPGKKHFISGDVIDGARVVGSVNRD